MMQDYTYYRGLRSGTRGLESGGKATPRVVQLRPAKQSFRRNAKEAMWLEPISELAAVGPSSDF
jgi:hypothetical protein